MEHLPNETVDIIIDLVAGAPDPNLPLLFNRYSPPRLFCLSQT